MPLLKLKNPFETPPGYFRFPRHVDRPLTDNPKDYVIGGDLADLIFKVTQFRTINRLPLGDVEAEVGDWLCRHSGAPCVPANIPAPQPGRKVRGGDVARFLGAMAEWVRSAEIVPQEEAEQRAEACAGCKWNSPTDDAACLGCFGLMARIMRVIGQRRTRMDGILKFCGRCGCSLPVVVFAPAAVLDRAHRNADFKTTETGQVDAEGKPIMCWRGDLK